MFSGGGVATLPFQDNYILQLLQHHELVQQQLWQPSARLSLGICPP
jgi:hypothetical protein